MLTDRHIMEARVALCITPEALAFRAQINVSLVLLAETFGPDRVLSEIQVARLRHAIGSGPRKPEQQDREMSGSQIRDLSC